MERQLADLAADMAPQRLHSTAAKLFMLPYTKQTLQQLVENPV